MRSFSRISLGRITNPSDERLLPGLKHCLIAVLCLWLGMVLIAPEAAAHSVYIYAWPDGPKVCTESYFSRQSKVVGGEVIMSGPDGRELGRARTGEDGGACFDLPDMQGALTFTVLAGQGHKSEYILDEAEIAEAVKTAAVQKSSPGGSPATQQASGDSLGIRSDSLRNAAVQPEEIRAIVREELQNQLGPLRHALAEANSAKDPGVREIAGGLGWIAGIAALAYWVTRKRRGSD